MHEMHRHGAGERTQVGNKSAKSSQRGAFGQKKQFGLCENSKWEVDDDRIVDREYMIKYFLGYNTLLSSESVQNASFSEGEGRIKFII